MDGYGNDFKLFYNTDLTSIKLIITIGYNHNLKNRLYVLLASKCTLNILR